MTDALIDRYGAVVLDVDGVLMRGREPVPGAAATLSALRARGVGVALATNNASRSPEEIAGWLGQAGLAVEPWMVATSSQATARMMRGGERAFVIGMPALRHELAAADVRLVDAPDEADTVVVGIDPQVCYPALRDAAAALFGGARFVATNLDPNLPDEDVPRPGNGAIVAVLRVTTEREPEVAGKPGGELIHAAIATFADPSGPVLTVGDRVDTDIVAGAAVGCDTALVLTGATSADGAAVAEPAPTWLLDDVSALLQPPPQ
jgi:HAD superfamily hydrolase (TIGR01450 family)